MEQFLVDFVILSDSLSLQEISNALGVACSIDGSREKGAISSLKKSPYPETQWRLESQAKRTASLEKHLKCLLKMLPIEELTFQGVLPPRTEFYLHIGMVFDSTLASADVRSAWLKPFVDLGVRIKFCAYPTRLIENAASEKRRKESAQQKRSLPRVGKKRATTQ